MNELRLAILVLVCVSALVTAPMLFTSDTDPEFHELEPADDADLTLETEDGETFEPDVDISYDDGPTHLVTSETQRIPIGDV